MSAKNNHSKWENTQDPPNTLIQGLGGTQVFKAVLNTECTRDKTQWRRGY